MHSLKDIPILTLSNVVYEKQGNHKYKSIIFCPLSFIR